MQLLNFRLHWQIWLFGPNLSKKGISSLNRNNKHGHWILHIRIRLATKFQLKLVILIFWTKFRQKGYFSSKTRKSEQHHWILHIGIRLATKFHLRLTCLIFSTKICPKSVFPVKNKKKKWTASLNSAYSNKARCHISRSYGTSRPMKREWTIYGTTRPRAKFGNENAMALLG